ncbi:MAG: BREX-3 system P-loop-containing protein BrxF [Bacillota bacterium]
MNEGRPVEQAAGQSPISIDPSFDETARTGDRGRVGEASDRLIWKIAQAEVLYYRLVLVTAPSGAGKTRLLQEVSKRTGAPLLNINLELSHRMLDLTRRQRAMQSPGLLSETVYETKSNVVLLDNIELLFDVELKQDPLRILQGISRNKTIVAAWNGSVIGGYLWLCHAWALRVQAL